MLITTHFWFLFAATDAWMIRPHRMQTRTVTLAASGDPDYLMPADVFKKPSWEPSTAQPMIQQSQPLPSSLSPAPAESINAASSSSLTEEDDMILISAATSVSRPPAPTTHPSALRPPANSQASVLNTPSSVLATPVDDRNILFWRDRMTAQEHERNQKGFRPAFQASINENVAQTMPEESTKSVSSEQVTPHEVSSDDRVTSAFIGQPDPLMAPAAPSLGVTTKQPVVGEIPVLFWRDRMNEQEEARNRQGFRKPFTDNTKEILFEETYEETLSINGVNGAAKEQPSVDLLASSSGVLTESNENTHIDGVVFTEDDLPELNLESTAATNEEEEIATIQTGKVDSISESVSMEIDNKAATYEDSTENTELNLQHATAVDEEEQIADLRTEEVDSISQPVWMEIENEDAVSDESEEMNALEITELNSVPVASSTMSETERLQETAALEAVEEDSVSRGALLESDNDVALSEAGQFDVPESDQGDESESALAVTKYSIAEVSLMDPSNKADVSDDVECSSEPLPNTPIAEIVYETGADVAGDPTLMETENNVAAPENLPGRSSEPVAITSVPETEQIEELDSAKDLISEPALTESDIINGANVPPLSEDEAQSILAESDVVDEPSGLEEKDVIFAPTSLDVNGHLSGDQEIADVESQLESTFGLTQGASVSERDPVDEIAVSSPVSDALPIGELNTVEKDAVAFAPGEPISAKSSTKDLLQYLFTGSTEGSDELTDETVSQYLADPNSVMAKLNGGDTAILNGKAEGSNGHVVTPANGQGNVPTPSTNELLDILFGVTEEKSTEDDESRRNGTSELLNSDAPKIETVREVLDETAKEEEEPEKEKLTSSKVREMALFTLKELLLQDRQ